MAAYEKHGCQFVISAQKTPRLVEELKAARWTGSPRTDADGQCEFGYQAEGWGRAHRFVALRYLKKAKPAAQHEQYQLFDTPEYTYRVFVTDMEAPIDVVVGFYRLRAGAENLIKEANNDAGLAAHPSARWSMNCVHFQLAMLAYNLNCWLMLFNREETAKVEDLRYTTLATARLRFLSLAAKIVRHAGAVLVRYSDPYAEQGTMGRLLRFTDSGLPAGAPTSDLARIWIFSQYGRSHASNSYCAAWAKNRSFGPTHSRIFRLASAASTKSRFPVYTSVNATTASAPVRRCRSTFLQAPVVWVRIEPRHPAG